MGWTHKYYIHAGVVCLLIFRLTLPRMERQGNSDDAIRKETPKILPYLRNAHQALACQGRNDEQGMEEQHTNLSLIHI